jgi:hypothetical protein
MPESPTKQNSLLPGVLASAIAALVLTGTNYWAARAFPGDPLLAPIVSAVAAVLMLVAAMRLRVINLYEIFGTKYLDAHTGIVRVYPSLHHAFDDLKAAFAQARRVDLLLHIGRQEFGVRHSLFTETLRLRASDPDFEVRILHFDEESPYLSEERAKRLGKRRQKWLDDVRYVRKQIDEICAEHANVRVAGHREPFVWRMFIFDNEMFVSGYLHQTRNDEHAPVFKIRSGTNSLYGAFRAYYDHLWRFYAVDLGGKDAHGDEAR